MFTGIITEVASIAKRGVDAIWVKANSFVQEPLMIGESVAINGVCLSVVEIDEAKARFEICEETFRKTSLANLTFGSGVNIERSLKIGQRLDGHIVLGHVDAAVKLMDMSDEMHRFSLPENISHLIAEKGSITIDGVSLTVGEVDDKSFNVYIIPHTKQNTLFSRYKKGDVVNIEADTIARYVERIATKNKAKNENA